MTTIRKNMLMSETLADLDAREKGRYAAVEGEYRYQCGCYSSGWGDPMRIELCPFHDGFERGVRIGYEHGLKHGKG